MTELQTAIKVLDSYRKRLDRSTRRCSHCGMVQKVNWKEYQRAEQLTGIIHKLSRWATEDEGKQSASRDNRA